MAHIEDYKTGKILEQIQYAFSIYDSADDQLPDSEIGQLLLKGLKKLEPTVKSMEDVSEMIKQSKKIAVGERVCNALHKDSGYAESVFLDDLADGMVEAGKARYATEDEAIDTIIKYKRGAIIVTKVSGNHVEICPTYPKKCVYWNGEKHGLKCIIR